ncbi:glycosyltransferase family 2 protein [Candidatus Methylopumilus universalis]|uniref:glycosyltransferase family A protein n=1 Tax=Candidatus Methylopumilus universalis TaxID=2588536 RepID=UPI001124AB29|nr:glycosyltransferase family 2 protein [Candidatus Methylopumilus universalis]QDC70794.1 glycosyltransferase family 2 protein [Candidatus Methylopumilus universalis]
MKIHPWQQKPNFISFENSKSKSIWTLVMPIFNQEKTIEQIIEKICKNSEYHFDAILINDGSDDGTLKKLLRLSKKNKKINRITIINNNTPIFETACDNQGFKCAKTEYIIEIQSDIYINDKNFDKKMIQAMNNFNLGAVSGRHVHKFSLIDPSKKKWLKYPLSYLKCNILDLEKESFGRVGDKLFKRFKANSNYCFIGETVARGPWLVRKSDLKNLNYLDEKNFFLGNDDHDYHRRIFQSFNRLVGYVPLNIYSIPENGSTRKKRTGINELIFNHLKSKKKGSKEYIQFLENYKPYAPIKRYQIK